jgi:autotransporter-associated beta strand protein
VDTTSHKVHARCVLSHCASPPLSRGTKLDARFASNRRAAVRGLVVGGLVVSLFLCASVSIFAGPQPIESSDFRDIVQAKKTALSDSTVQVFTSSPTSHLSTLNDQLSTSSATILPIPPPIPPAPGDGPPSDPDGTWTFDGSGTWSNPANWSGGSVADGGGFANFSTLNITGSTHTVTIDTTSRTVRRIDIGDTNASHSYIIAASGGASLIFDNTANSANAQLNQVANSNGDTISAPVVLNSSLDITNASSAVLTISGVVSNGSNGAAAIAHNGTGPLILTGVSTYSGGTTLSSGTLRAGSSSTVTGGVVASGAVGTGTLKLNGGTFSSDKSHSNGGDRTFENNLSLSGTVTLGDSSNTGALLFDSAGLTTPATINLSGNTSLTINNPTSQPVTFADAVTGGSNTLSKAGTGILVFSGTAANTYTGLTTVSAGELDLGKTSAIAIAGNLTIDGTGTVSLLNNEQINNNSSLTVNGSGTFDLDGKSETIDALNGSGTVTNTAASTTSTLTTGSNNGGGTFSGVLRNGASGRVLALTKSGSGTLTLSGANTYTGGSSVNAGTLQFAKTTSMPSSGTVTVASGATLAVNAGGASEWTNGASGNGTLGGLISGTGGQGAPVSWTAGSVLGIDTTNASGGLTYTGVIGSFNTGGNSVGLTKLGSNSLTLGAANTYTGATTIKAGTLNASVANALGGTSGITVNSGGTLLLSGSSGVTDRINNSATMNLNGGTFNTGGLSENGSVGIGALTLSNNSTIDLGTGTSVINFANSSAATWVSGKTLTILDWSGSTSGGGTDQLIFGSDSSGLSSGQIAQVIFQDPAGFSSGNYGAMILMSGELVPVAIPEPGTWLACGLALSVLLYTQRRKLSYVISRATLSRVRHQPFTRLALGAVGFTQRRRFAHIYRKGSTT